MAGPSSTISVNSIVDVGIVDDIVGEIVTCGRVLSPAYILATMPVYDPTELSRANRVATVQRSLRRLNHIPSDFLEAADVYAPWCHLVFRHVSVTTAVVIG